MYTSFYLCKILYYDTKRIGRKYKAYNGGIDYKSIMGINNTHDIVKRQVFIDGNNIEVCI